MLAQVSQDMVLACPVGISMRRWQINGENPVDEAEVSFYSKGIFD